MIEEIDEIEAFRRRLEGMSAWVNNEFTNRDIMQIVQFLQELKNIKLDYLDKKSKTNEKVICYRNDVLNIDALIDVCFVVVNKSEETKGEQK